MFKFATKFALLVALLGATASATLAGPPKGLGIKTGPVLNSNSKPSASLSRPQNINPILKAPQGLNNSFKLVQPSKGISTIGIKPLKPLDPGFGKGKPIVDNVKPFKPFPAKPILDPVKSFHCGTFPTNCWPNQGCGSQSWWGCGGFGGIFGGGVGCWNPGYGCGNYCTLPYPCWHHCHTWFNYCPSYCTPIYTTPIYVETTPVVTTTVAEVAAPAVAAPAPAAAEAAIDLLIDGVVLLDAGDISKNLGPMVRVTVSNKGTLAAGKFALGVYASLQEQPSKEMIPAGEMLDELAAGASRTVDVRLPVEVLGMTAAGATNKEMFKQLFVVADVENKVVESNKQNNILPMKRDQLALK